MLSIFVDEGFVVSHRGRGGGLDIADKGSDATAKTVVVMAERDRSQGTPEDAPAATPVGRLPEALEAAQRAYLDALDAYTIADLAATPPAGLDLRGAPTIGSQLR